MKAEGRERMIGELQAAVALFDKADHAVGAFAKSYRVKLGITEAVLQQSMSRYYEEQGLAGKL